MDKNNHKIQEKKTGASRFHGQWLPAKAKDAPSIHVDTLGLGSCKDFPCTELQIATQAAPTISDGVILWGFNDEQFNGFKLTTPEGPLRRIYCACTFNITTCKVVFCFQPEQCKKRYFYSNDFMLDFLDVPEEDRMEPYSHHQNNRRRQKRAGNNVKAAAGAAVNAVVTRGSGAMTIVPTKLAEVKPEFI